MIDEKLQITADRFSEFLSIFVVEFNSIVRWHTFFPNLGSDPIFGGFYILSYVVALHFVYQARRK